MAKATNWLASIWQPSSSPPSSSSPRLYELFGNIGVGKSTLGRALASPELEFVEESIDAALLAAFVAEPRRYALAMQLRTLSQRQVGTGTVPVPSPARV